MIKQCGKCRKDINVIKEPHYFTSDKYKSVLCIDCGNKEYKREVLANDEISNGK